MACYNDAFSDISSDEEFVRLTQLMELSLSSVDTEISQEDIVFVAVVGQHRYYKTNKHTEGRKDIRRCERLFSFSPTNVSGGFN